MKNTTFKESQIVGITKSHEQGVNVPDIASEHGLCKATLYK